jgi:hypothetical protein
VTLEILDADGRVVRRFASTDSAPPVRDTGDVPAYWIRPPQALASTAGMHRFVWDLHGERPAGVELGFPIAAVIHDTPQEPRGPWAVPGTYTLRLTVDGRTFTQPLAVRMDPRVSVPDSAIRRQHATTLALMAGMARADSALRQVAAFRTRVQALKGASTGVRADSLAAADTSAAALSASSGDGLRRIHGQLTDLYNVVEGVDAEPTTQALAAVADRLAALDAALRRWDELRRSAALPPEGARE